MRYCELLCRDTCLTVRSETYFAAWEEATFRLSPSHSFPPPHGRGQWCHTRPRLGSSRYLRNGAVVFACSFLRSLEVTNVFLTPPVARHSFRCEKLSVGVVSCERCVCHLFAACLPACTLVSFSQGWATLLLLESRFVKNVQHITKNKNDILM